MSETAVVADLDFDLDSLSVTEAEELLGRMPAKTGRGRPSGPRGYNRKDQLQEIWGKHKEMIRLHILGFKSIAIAEQLNITAACVSHVLNSSIVKAHIDDLQNRADDNTIDMNKRFRETALEAQSLLSDVLLDKDGDHDINLKVKVAMDQLDRAGHAPIKKIEAKVALGIFDGTDVSAMAAAAKEINAAKEVAKENGNLASEEG